MIAPAWISKILLEEALSRFYEDQHIVINNFESEAAVPTGENFLSNIFRISISYTDSKSGKGNYISIIAKCEDASGSATQSIATELKAFEKESEMFSKILPALQRLLGQELSPKCFYTSLHPHHVILLEDLSPLGFKVLSRHEGLDLNHCLQVMEKLAEIHASSAVLSEQDPSSMNTYDYGLFNRGVEDLQRWLKAGIQGIKDACRNWTGFEKYAEKISSLGNEIATRGLKALEMTPGGFNVLNHGDLWVNNIMFLYDEDRNCKDLRFIDFQLSYYTSPAIDLNHFIATSLNRYARYEHIDIILNHYYDNLLATLGRLNHSLEKVPSRTELKEDFRNRSSYGLIVSVTTLALFKADRRPDATFENQMMDESPEGFRRHTYNNHAYRRQLEFLLPYYNSLGILD